MQKKRFKVTVNGREFDVEVEELDGGSSSPASGTPSPTARTAPPTSRAPGVPNALAATKAPSGVATTAPANASNTSSDNQPGWIRCPMTGKIMKIPVKVGDVVKAGAVVAILEAMKMETAICAPAAGKIEEIAVQEGAVVDSDTRLVRCV